MTDSALWGISSRYQDHRGEWRDAPQSTIEALLAAMGAEDDTAVPPSKGEDSRVRVVPAGETVPLIGRWLLRTEEGRELAIEQELPPDVPTGYHLLRREHD
ncbi:MAG: hypothetical protein ABIS21_03825, partial [Acidimicrobiales bacterium]